MTVSRDSHRRLEKALGHRFSNPSLLTEALTHRGAATKTKPSNERLEFLGDRVLGLAIAEMLFTRFAGADEGELSRRLTALVRRDALAEIADDLDLGALIHFSPSDVESGRINAGLLANACEAVIGALFLDGAFEAARAFIVRAWAPMIEREEGAERDAKTRLQEWAQGRGKKLPRYEVTSRDGPPHAPQFAVTVHVEGEDPATGAGPSKRVAEQAAAAALLACLADVERKRS
jgi:ribonuclease-3